MALQTTSRLFIILKTLGAMIETELEKKFNPDFINKCDKVDIEPMGNFDATRYLGTWYETAHVKEFDVFQPGDSVCIEAEYTDLGNNQIQVVNSYQTGSVSEQGDNLESTGWGISRRKSITGKALCDSATDAAACKVEFFNSPFPDVANYNVIDTDYDSYAIVYNCDTASQFQIVWILSRVPVMPEATLIKVMSIISEKIPNFSPTHFDGITYQGPKCTYAKNN